MTGLTVSDERAAPARLETAHPRFRLLLGFLLCYVLCAAFFQLRGKVPPWIDGAPIEYFTGGLLWMLSLVSLLIADRQRGPWWKAAFWLAACAGFAVLALDEIFRLHERTEPVLHDEDHLQVAQLVVTVGVVYFLSRIEALPKRAKYALVIGLVIHGAYVFLEVADGDYFRLPFLALETQWWVEEFLELFSLAAYFAGFTFLYTGLSRAVSRDGVHV